MDCQAVADPHPPERRYDSAQKTSLTLLDLLRKNDSEAWRKTVHLYTPLVHHWLGRSGVRGADADDLVQEVFRIASSNLATFRHDRPGDTFRGWLRGIARNLVLKHFHRQGRQPQASGGTDAFRRLQHVADALPPDDEEETESELGGLYHRALELVRTEFEERTWQAFWLTAVESRTPREISATLGMTPVAIRKAKSRVLHRLREQVGDLVD